MVSVKNLSKQYGSNLVLNNISFTLKQGVYGFLGVNGAGKSTTMNIMSGCLSATSGTVEINGYNILSQPIQAKKSLGYLPEVPPLYFGMTPLEHLRFISEMRGIPSGDRSKCIEQVISETGIGSVSNLLIRNLSKGYRQRVGIASAILGQPDTIILDEPISGLDPMQIHDLKALIVSLGQAHTVFLSSHLLAEISDICDYYLILSNGRLAAQGSFAELNRRLSSATSIDLMISGDLSLAEKVLKNLPFVIKIKTHVTSSSSAKFVLTLKGIKYDEAASRILLAFSDVPCSISSINNRSQSLEKLFFGIVSDSPSEPG